jgi:geranylgeranyl pyrophosphate synthase
LNNPVGFESALDGYRTRVDAALKERLPSQGNTNTPLESAMRYATLSGGKRVRPVLIYATGEALNAPAVALDVLACSIEFMHAYTLVHDDLPSMDDDDLRRGVPTCHIKYGEAQAILAGDALQALAFTTLASSLRGLLPDSTILQMIELFGQASGVNGMAAGQAIDLQSVGQALTLPELEAMHRLKTGALIKASTLLGALCSPDVDDSILASLGEYGDAIGMAFQVADDILDVVGDTQVLGKQQGADIALNKPTFPAIMGLERARDYASQQRDRALDAIAPLDNQFDLLRQLAIYVVNRTC